MDLSSQLLGWVLHIDTHLELFISTYHNLTYAILAAIVFVENGIVLVPFLPGDSLVFVCGAFAARGALDVWILSLVLVVSSILGAILNYWIGIWASQRFKDGKIPFVNAAHIEKTRVYFDKYGGMTIVMARFFPIIRTFAPFFAGLGAMAWAQFLIYTVFGSVLWVGLFMAGGYFFGAIPWVAQNMVAVVMGILVLSICPLLIRGLFLSRSLSKKSKTR